MITLKNLHEATEQEVFDQVVSGIISQGKPAVDSSTGKCVYRSEEGLRCAAGQLVTEDEYDTNMEGMPWREFIYQFETDKMNTHTDLIQALQSIHDDASPCINFRWKFKEDCKVLCEERGLVWKYS